MFSSGRKQRHTSRTRAIGFLAGNLLPFQRMSALSWFRIGSLRESIRARYAESGCERYGMDVDTFEQHVTAVVQRYAGQDPVAHQIALVKSLHIEELVLARACSAGNETAWDVFLTRYRAELHRAGCQITRDESSGREIADGLYAELYGLPNREGRRVSKFDYYMGRGSLGGWLRTLMAQKHIDQCRRGARDVSLEEQMESGVAFTCEVAPAISPNAEPVSAAISGALTQCSAEERFLLAAYFLDGFTLAQIGKQVGVHESTISRKLDRVTARIRKDVRKRLMAMRIGRTKCDELLAELDVRDLNVNVNAGLRQEKGIETF
jgi:RNA polymerase sigma-70 factor (ECF subfamily)